MLKGLNPLLSADLLFLLRSLGHGDEIAIVDCNFPAVTNAKRLIRLPGANATQALDAVLSVMPLDTFVDCAAFYMTPVTPALPEQPIFAEFRSLLLRHETAPQVREKLEGIERFAFYERTKSCFGLIATDERRLWGNIILKMGVIMP